MTTTVNSKVDRDDLRLLRDAVRVCLPALSWRWHGVGCLQAYLREGGEVETRVHLWDLDLVLPGIGRSGSIHNHRFDMRSTILAGELDHFDYHVNTDIFGDHIIYEFVNARQHNDDNRLRMNPVARASVRLRQRHCYSAGDRYDFEAGEFHASAQRTANVAVTLVEKRGQRSIKANVAAPAHLPPVPAFSGVLTDELLRSVVSRAEAALRGDV